MQRLHNDRPDMPDPQFVLLVAALFIYRLTSTWDHPPSEPTYRVFSPQNN